MNFSLSPKKLTARVITGLAFGLLASLSLADKPTKTLNIGDPAPSISAARWLKGAPVSGFKKGNVYVVEFWATWCHPCRDNIPHLTELAKKYQGKVSIIGVSIWESLSDDSKDEIAKVRKFVASEGHQMDYLVAADSKANTIADSWMKPAGEGGIPCSFIIDRTGKIAWIGHPAKMEENLTQVLNGTFDVNAARTARETETQISRPISDAMASKDYKALLKAVDKAEALRPKMHENLMYSRLVALYHIDVPQAEKVSRAVIKESDGALGAYQMMTSIGAAYDDLKPEAYKITLSIVDEELAQQPTLVMMQAIKAEICFHLHDKANALATLHTATTLAEKDPNITPAFRELLKKSLVKYQAMP